MDEEGRGEGREGGRVTERLRVKEGSEAASEGVCFLAFFFFSFLLAVRIWMFVCLFFYEGKSGACGTMCG